MKKYIVITSIFPPSEAIIKFSELEDYELVVVGDKKSPENWHVSGALYLSIDDQENVTSSLGKLLPYNHYCRKMMGYLHAIKNGADVIVDTDDDNIPKSNWMFPDFSGEFESILGNEGFVNIYSYYTKNKIWPRGLPLRLINRLQDTNNTETRFHNVGVWQGLADEDPDVDAIYRLTSNEICNFRERPPLVLQNGTYTPFNSQNTAVIKDLFPLMYLPCYVTFRFTDILRGIVAQPIMWAAGYSLGFTNATVVQKRNPHDYFKDFSSEIPVYLHVERVAELVDKTTRGSNSIRDNLYNAYDELAKNEIVTRNEVDLLNAWLFDCTST